MKKTMAPAMRRMAATPAMMPPTRGPFDAGAGAGGGVVVGDTKREGEVVEVVGVGVFVGVAVGVPGVEAGVPGVEA
jgi:hypothetical protein